MLQNSGHGEIIRVCMGIFTTALKNENIDKFSIKCLILLPQCITSHLTAYYIEGNPF